MAMALGRYASAQPASRGRMAATMLVFVVLALLPDVDFLLPLLLGTDAEGPLGHRGASHSVAFAALVGLLVHLLTRRGRLTTPGAALLATAIVLTHPLLDMLTADSPGVALLWPFTDARLASPWRPLPIAPFGHALFTSRGLMLLLVEVAVFLPLWAYALWPRGIKSPARTERH